MDQKLIMANQSDKIIHFTKVVPLSFFRLSKTPLTTAESSQISDYPWNVHGRTLLETGFTPAIYEISAVVLSTNCIMPRESRLQLETYVILITSNILVINIDL